MLNMAPLKDAKGTADYFSQSDGGYYLKDDGLRREFGGKGAAMLGLTGAPTPEQLQRLLHGLDPHTGGQLTARLAGDRIPARDFTARLPKGVTTAMEGGDERIQPMFWEAANEAMAMVERYAMTRVRKGGMDADRTTSNLVWLAVEHPDTRPTKEDGKPDWDRHIHFLVFNLTKDFAEGGQWKALKAERIFELRKFFSHSFDLLMSKKLADAGYKIRTDLKPAGRGGMKYHTWDIEAAPGHEKGWNSINRKNSRRHQEIEDKKTEIVAAMKGRDPDAPDRLGAVAGSKLALTTRLNKLKDMTLARLREYWASRITPEEALAIAETVKRAKLGLNPKPPSKAAEAMAYAIAHKFQRNSVLDWHDLAAAAMERSMGAALPGEFEAEARRQGVLFKDGQCSTQDVLDQEQRIIGFARERGTCRPLAAQARDGLDGLSDEQKAAVRHVWDSTDAVMLIRGGAGTGKTTAMTPALAKLGAPVALLAPSAQASRTTLREEGAKDARAAAAFSQANTVSSFLGDRERQETVRGGIIWCDEAGMLPIDDLDGLCRLAKSLDARIVLQGDPAQHRAVDRDGNMLEVLQDYAGLPVAKLTQIQRQKGEYARIVEAIRDKKFANADGRMRKQGWVVEGSHDALAAEYAKAIEETNPDGSRRSVIVIDPTHKDGDALTERLRRLRKDKGLVGLKEKTFSRLVQIDMTHARKGDAGQYSGDEVIQFFRNSGKFKAGQRVKAAELLPHLAEVNPRHFGVFKETDVNFAVGDAVRITSNGWDVTKKHRLDNGYTGAIKRFAKDGGIVLDNNWAIAPGFAHFRHGLVETSPATQSKTKDVVLTAMNKAALGAVSARQLYVTISRGRARGMIFTDMTREELLEAVARDDTRKSATELFYRKPECKPEAAQAAKTPGRARAAGRMRAFMEKVRSVYRQWEEKAARAARVALTPREPGYER